MPLIYISKTTCFLSLLQIKSYQIPILYLLTYFMTNPQDFVQVTQHWYYNCPIALLSDRFCFILIANPVNCASSLPLVSQSFSNSSLVIVSDFLSHYWYYIRPITLSDMSCFILITNPTNCFSSLTLVSRSFNNFLVFIRDLLPNPDY